MDAICSCMRTKAVVTFSRERSIESLLVLLARAARAFLMDEGGILSKN